MTTYFVDMGGTGDLVEVDAEGPEAAIRAALVSVCTDDFAESFDVMCGEDPDGDDAWSYTVTLERIERVHVRRSR